MIHALLVHTQPMVNYVNNVQLEQLLRKQDHQCVIHVVVVMRHSITPVVYNVFLDTFQLMMEHVNNAKEIQYQPLLVHVVVQYVQMEHSPIQIILYVRYVQRDNIQIMVLHAKTVQMGRIHELKDHQHVIHVVVEEHRILKELSASNVQLVIIQKQMEDVQSVQIIHTHMKVHVIVQIVVLD